MMRTRPAPTPILALPAVLLAITAAGPGLAQERPAPAAAERKAFNAVPGPDAEYVLLSDRYTLLADGSVVHDHTTRLQVNSYLAINRKYGESKVGYDPAIETMEVVTNRTVLPSGRVVEAPANAVVDDQPPGAEGNPLWSGLRRKIIVHTALEPGAVIEEAYRITLKVDDGAWLDFGEPLAAEVPIRERIVAWDVPASVKERVSALVSMGPVTPTLSESADRAVWTWRQAGVPAVPEEPGAPPRSEALPFLWVSTRSWDDTAAELARRIEAAGPAPESAVAAARQAVARETSWEPRLLAALAAITGSVNVSGITPPLQHWQIKTLAEVWRSGYATPLELATLQAKVLMAAGFSAEVALLAPPARNRNTAPGFAGFDRPLLRVAAEDGSPRLYDPADPAAGTPIEARIAGPLLVPRSPGFEVAPAAAPARRDLTVVAEVGADGSLSGSLALLATGAATPQAALVREPEKLAEDLAGAVAPGAKTKARQITSLARQRATLEVGFEGTLPEKSEFGLVRFAIPSVPGGADDDLPLLPAAGRRAPLALPGPVAETVDVTLTLPAGWTVAALPVPASVSNPVGLVEIASTQDADGTIHLVRRIGFSERAAAADQAAQVRELLVAWLAPSGRDLLLRPPASPVKK
jgi:Domain of Unknown Function with PDB structure (DUF3857)/Domain of Unknown Function with PDB structure (DUF3858)